SLFQLLTGHQSAVGVAYNQPAKLAAFEAHFDSSAVAPLHLFGWVNEDKQEVNFGIAIPKFLSFLVYNNTTTPVTGLNAFAKADRPPVQIVFQSYHLMVAIGMTLIALALVSVFLWMRGRLVENRLMLQILVASVLLPQLANQLGWISAEVGRQPWIVYGLLRTADAFSKSVTSSQVVFSLVLFALIYVLLFVLFIFLLDRKIKHGPGDDMPTEYEHQKQLFTEH
ncbi:MAG TPA: cytochrome ubiquinol oxidase subunit I, partial [Bacteroidota bacterium]|nr:cytochrome ubiquinol oxidase subunit I [Bacteroidota bacterium]